MSLFPRTFLQRSAVLRKTLDYEDYEGTHLTSVVALYLPVWMVRCRRRVRPVLDSGYLNPGLRNMRIPRKDPATERLHLITPNQDLVDQKQKKIGNGH